MESTLLEVAIFGGGCFWCTEAAFSALRGVMSIVPGYAGGSVENPTYEQVCSGQTGHAEVVHVTYNPSEVSYRDLLGVFFAVHDPTTLNRQGNDVGTQYRSVIFTTTNEQAKLAQEFMAELVRAQVYDHPLVTAVQSLERFYEAESYHHEYYQNNPDKPYCQAVINPKLKKLKERYASLLKTSSINSDT